MKRIRHCDNEGYVVEAVRSGQWKDSLRDHIAVCSICQEVVQVSRWMQRLAEITLEPLPLPDPGLILLRCRLLQKRAAAQRVMRPLEIFHKVAYAVTALTLTAWLFGKRSQIEVWLSSLDDHWLKAWSLTGSIALSFPLVSLIAGLCCITVIVTIYNVLAQE